MVKSTFSKEQIRQQIIDLMLEDDRIAGQCEEVDCFQIEERHRLDPNWDAVCLKPSTRIEVQAAFEAAKAKVQQLAILQLPVLGGSCFR